MNKHNRCFKGLVKIQGITTIKPNCQYLNLEDGNIFIFEDANTDEVDIKNIGRLVIESKQVIRNEKGIKIKVETHYWELKHSQWLNSASNGEVNNPNKFVYFVPVTIAGLKYAQILSKEDSDEINARRKELNSKV